MSWRWWVCNENVLDLHVPVKEEKDGISLRVSYRGRYAHLMIQIHPSNGRKQSDHAMYPLKPDDSFERSQVTHLSPKTSSLAFMEGGKVTFWCRREERNLARKKYMLPLTYQILLNYNPPNWILSADLAIPVCKETKEGDNSSIWVLFLPRPTNQPTNKHSNEPNKHEK